jgi:hypothetical protein
MTAEQPTPPMPSGPGAPAQGQPSDHPADRAGNPAPTTAASDPATSGPASGNPTTSGHTTSGHTTSGPGPVRRPRASLWALRTIAVLHCGVIAAQPVFAGIFLTVVVDSIAVHEMNSHLVSLLGWCQIIAALVYASRGGGRWSPMWFSLALAVAEETQKVLGYLRLADHHIPMGVSLITLQVLFTVWLFRPAARQARVDKPRTGGRAVRNESRSSREPNA